MISFLQVENLTKSFGDLVLFKNISFGIGEGERVGLIAKNGSGKTTLLNILSPDHEESEDSGSVAYRSGLRVGYLSQMPSYPSDLTVLQACFHSDSEVVQTIAAYERAVAAEDHDLVQELIYQMDYHKAWDYESRIKQILSELKVRNWDQRISQLSGGQLKRVAMANVLIAEPELIILDEPTNHLDLEMIEWLEVYLNRSRMSLLMVTHDRYFLDRVCNSILEIDQKQVYSYKGNYSYYLEKREERIAAQNADVERASNLYRKELDWMRRQPQARATKAKSRIDAFYDIEKRAKQQRQEDDVRLDVKASYIGNKIFEATDLCKSYGNLTLLDHFSYTFARYEKMGIVGNNGTGKSTFIKILTGAVAPDSGTIDIGETVRFGYYSQDGLEFDNSLRVIDVVQNIAEYIDLGNGARLSASQFLQHFLFEPETQYGYVFKLSGGEKRRLYLCTVLMRNPNFLVLDEPTNDLDIVTLNVLEEYLQSFKGCVIVVSHDRYFMDKVVDHVLVFQGEGKLKDFPGNYTDYRDWAEDKLRLEKAEQVVKQTAKSESRNDSRRPEQSPDKKKMSFKEKRELESIEEELPLLESEKNELELAMSSGVLFNDELLAKSQRIEEVIAKIDALSERWLELSM